MIRLALVATVSLAAISGAALAQDAEQAPPPAPTSPSASAPATNSGVLKRVPLDQWMPENCPNPERRGEIVVCGRPDEEPTVETPPPVPGDPGTDVQSERLKLIAPESAAPSTSCTAVGPGGDSGCSRNEYEQWRRERQLQKAQEKTPKPR